MWCKRRLDPAGGSAADDATFFGAAPASGPVHPIAALDAGPCTEQLGHPGPWHERLPHFRLGFNPSSGQELQSELFVAAHDGPAALRVLAGMADELAAVLMVSEVRAVAADDLWLSPCYGRQSIALHFTWVPSWPDVRPVLADLERALAPFEPRPHWGKLTTLPAATVRSRHPRLADAEALRTRWDPNGRFRNGYLEELLA